MVLAADRLILVSKARKSVLSQTNRRRFFLTRGDYERPEQVFERQVGAPDKAVRVPRPRVSVAYGRILTLEAATDLEPDVLNSLGVQPLDAFRRSGWSPAKDGALSYAVLQNEPKLRALRCELEGWSRAFHLTDTWCLEIALSTLARASGDGELRWFEAQTHFGRPRPFYVTFAAPLGLPPYDPVYQRRSDYVSHARNQLNPRYQKLLRELEESVDSVIDINSYDEEYRLMDRMRECGDRLPRKCGLTNDHERCILEYIERVEAEARRQGLVAVPRELRQPMMFHWLAGHRVCGWTPRQIARAVRVYKGTEVYHNAIVHGIKKMSAHIGLTLRSDSVPSPRGKRLELLVTKIREAMDPEQITARRARLQVSRPAAIFSDDDICEAPRVTRNYREAFTTSVSK
jgi:hypothetical protein